MKLTLDGFPFVTKHQTLERQRPTSSCDTILSKANIFHHLSRLALREITVFSFIFVFFLPPDFHELWHSVISICLLTDVKQKPRATFVLGWVIVEFYTSCGMCLSWNLQLLVLCVTRLY